MEILVVSTAMESSLLSSSAELIACAKKLTSAVTAAVLGNSIEGAAAEAVAYGADRVYAVEHEMLLPHDADAHLQALEGLVREVRPGAVLLTGDPLGNELAARLAWRLGSGAVTSCSRITSPEDGRLTFTRPVYGGKAMAEVEIPGTPQIATVTPRSFEPLPRDGSRRADIVRFAATIDRGSQRVKVLEVLQEEAEGVRLEDAKVVVSGGRGLGDGANFALLGELAKVLGAAVGASRAAVDAGWVPPSMQVGQTGKQVAPDLYVGVGISGATQHVAGMGRAKHIVVVNKDPEAPFFRIAELGVAADYKRVLPPLIRELRALLGS